MHPANIELCPVSIQPGKTLRRSSSQTSRNCRPSLQCFTLVISVQVPVVSTFSWGSAGSIDAPLPAVYECLLPVVDALPTCCHVGTYFNRSPSFCSVSSNKMPFLLCCKFSICFSCFHLLCELIRCLSWCTVNLADDLCPFFFLCTVLKSS